MTRSSGKWDYDELGRDTDVWGPYTRRVVGAVGPWLVLLLTSYAVGRAAWGLTGVEAVLAGAVPGVVLAHLFCAALRGAAALWERAADKLAAWNLNRGSRPTSTPERRSEGVRPLGSYKDTYWYKHRP